MKIHHTTTVTQFGAYVKEPNGIWKQFPGVAQTKEEVETKIVTHNQLAKEYSSDFTFYPEHKIIKRTIVTTFSEWSEV